MGQWDAKRPHPKGRRKGKVVIPDMERVGRGHSQLTFCAGGAAGEWDATAAAGPFTCHWRTRLSTRSRRSESLSLSSLSSRHKCISRAPVPRHHFTISADAPHPSDRTGGWEAVMRVGGRAGGQPSLRVAAAAGSQASSSEPEPTSCEQRGGASTGDEGS